MSLLFATIAKDGVIFASERTSKGTHKETGKVTTSTLTKSFSLDEKCVYGICGSSILSPEDINRYIKKNVRVSKSATKNLSNIIKAFDNYHDMYHFNNYEVGIMIAGYEEGRAVLLRYIWERIDGRHNIINRLEVFNTSSPVLCGVINELPDSNNLTSDTFDTLESSVAFTKSLFRQLSKNYVGNIGLADDIWILNRNKKGPALIEHL